MNLVAPEIPDAQRNQGPALFLQSLGQGLQAMARFAEMKRQSESDILRLATQERMAQQEHELGKQKLELETEYRNHEMRMEQELLPYKKMEMEATADWKRATFGQRALLTAKNSAEEKDFQQRLISYGLADPNPKNPVQFYANAQKLHDEFRFSSLPRIKQGLKEVKTTTESHTLPLLINKLEIDDATGEQTLKPKMENVSIGKIFEGLKDPTKQDSIVAALERSGYFEEPKDNPAGNPDAAGVKHQGTTTVLKDEVRKILEQGKNVNFSRSKARTLLPGVEESTLFEPTTTDKLMQDARDAIARGAPRDAVLQELQTKHGIDPTDFE